MSWLTEIISRIQEFFIATLGSSFLYKNNRFRIMKYIERGIWGNDFDPKWKYGFTFGTNKPLWQQHRTVKLKAPQERCLGCLVNFHISFASDYDNHLFSEACLLFLCVALWSGKSWSFRYHNEALRRKMRQAWSFWWIWVYSFIATMLELLRPDLKQKDESDSHLEEEDRQSGEERVQFDSSWK